MFRGVTVIRLHVVHSTLIQNPVNSYFRQKKKPAEAGYSLRQSRTNLFQRGALDKLTVFKDGLQPVHFRGLSFRRNIVLKNKITFIGAMYAQ